jgi:hypothetical protein
MDESVHWLNVSEYSVQERDFVNVVTITVYCSRSSACDVLCCGCGAADCYRVLIC